MKVTHLIVGAIGALSANAVFAAAEEEEKPKVSREVLSETVTVTAEADIIEKEKTPSPVIVIDAKKIEEAGSNRLTRLLELAFPGRIAAYGGIGTGTSLFINGARSADTVVMMDGIRISNRNISSNFANLSLIGISRVEVLPVPASTLYGSDAHGGVVSLSSSGPSAKGLSGYALGQGSSIGQMRSGALAAYGWDTGWFQGGGDTEQSPQAIKSNLNYRQATGYVNFGQQLGDDALFTISHNSTYVGTPLPFDWDWNYWPAKRTHRPDRESMTWQSITTASLKSYFPNRLYAELNVGNFKQNGEQDTYSSFKHDLDQTQANAKATWKADKASVTLLGDFLTEKYGTLYYDSWNDNAPVNTRFETQKLAFALEGSIEPLPILRLVGSVRQQSDEIKPTEGSISGGYTGGANPPAEIPDGFSIDVDTMTWKLGANLLLPSGFRGYASAGTSFNTPSSGQLAYNKKWDKPAVDSETSQSILAGVGYNQSAWWVKADVSRINYDTIIVWKGAAVVGQGYYENASDLQVQGLEVAGGIKGNGWDADVWVRSQEVRDLTLDGKINPITEEPENPLAVASQNRPFFSAGFRAGYVLDNMNFGIDFSYIGHRYEYDGVNKTHYIDCSLRYAIQWNKSLSTTIRAERLFQDGISMEDWLESKDLGKNNMSVRMGYPSHGRAISAEVRYKF
jgi:outer membrane cobalamin receptor